MERVIRFLLLIFLLLPFRGTNADAFTVRKDLRSFQVPSVISPINRVLADHPDMSGTEYTFLPPANNVPLYITLSESNPTVARFSLSTGNEEIRLPASGGSFTVKIILPAGSLLYSVELTGNPGFQTGADSLVKPAATLSLDKPDSLMVSMPVGPDGPREIRLGLRGSGKVEFSPAGIQPEDEPFLIIPFKDLRHYQFSTGDYKSAEWNISPVGNLDFFFLEPVQAPDFPEALLRDGGQILDNPPEKWRNRDFEVYRWAPLPDILIFDCYNYDIQNRLFRRLSYFVEKKGFSGTLMTNSQLAGLHGWNAHDYRPSDLADFFNLVEKLDFSIYPEEEMLLLILLKHNILERNSLGLLTPGKGAILSISRETSDILRKRFLTHEASHGLYFTSGEYRTFARETWDSLEEEDRRMWRFFLGWYGYDPENEDLMINEFQAYLVQQSPGEAPSYFGSRMSGLAISYPGQKRILNRGTGPDAEAFRQWAGQFSDWIEKKWSLESGDFSTLRKELH